MKPKNDKKQPMYTPAYWLDAAFGPQTVKQKVSRKLGMKGKKK